MEKSFFQKNFWNCFFKKFWIFFWKQILSERKCIQKVSRKYFLKYIFLFGKPVLAHFRHKFGSQKFRSKKSFFKKIPENLFFKKISTSLEKNFKKYFVAKYYFEKNILLHVSLQFFAQQKVFSKIEILTKFKKHFSAIKFQKLFPETIFFTKIMNF